MIGWDNNPYPNILDLMHSVVIGDLVIELILQLL